MYCWSKSDLFHLTCLSPVPSIFLKIKQFYSFLLLNNTHNVYFFFFIHSSVDGHLGWFHNLVIMNNAVIYMRMLGISSVCWLPRAHMCVILSPSIIVLGSICSFMSSSVSFMNWCVPTFSAYVYNSS
jgi:hypothetical protein